MRGACALLLALLLGFGGVPRAEGPGATAGTRFVSVSFHDVVDSPRDLQPDAITTDRLVGFLEWIQAGGMHPVSLDDIEAARRGERPLPERALLITFDDGYRSLYTRVYPLLLAYHIPVISALVGDWMDAPMDAAVRYGDADVPRRNFISWPEAREMAASGLVEFASHGYALHGSVIANPQGGRRPVALGRIYDPQTGYEPNARFRGRIAADLERSRALMRRELGAAPRSLVWPFGGYRGAAREIARDAGFTFALSLEDEPADATRPLDIARFPPAGDPPLGELVGALRVAGLPPPVQSMACVDPAQLAGGDFEARLGATIDRMQRIGATAVAIDPFVRDARGAATAAWFPTDLMPVRADLLSRIAWQLQTRAHVDIYLRLPATMPAQRTPEAVAALARDLAAAAEVDGVLFEDAAAFDTTGSAQDTTSWEIRARRTQVDLTGLLPTQANILATFRAMEREFPAAKLALVLPAANAPDAVADLTFVAVDSGVDAAKSADDVASGLGHAGRRLGPWITAQDGAPDGEAVRAIAREFKVRGAMLAGWCPDDPFADRPAAATAGETSASRTPK